MGGLGGQYGVLNSHKHDFEMYLRYLVLVEYEAMISTMADIVILPTTTFTPDSYHYQKQAAVVAVPLLGCCYGTSFTLP